MPWIRKPCEPLPWLKAVREHFGNQLTATLLGAKVNQVGAWINGTYPMNDRFKSSALFIGLLYLQGVSRDDVVEMMDNGLLIERYICDREERARLSKQKKARAWDARNKERLEEARRNYGRPKKKVQRLADLIPASPLSEDQGQQHSEH